VFVRNAGSGRTLTCRLRADRARRMTWGVQTRHHRRMEYEEIPQRDFEEVFELILDTQGEEFSTLLRSAALYASREDFGRLLDRAVRLAKSDLDAWAVAEAVSVAVQARSIVPVNVDEVLKRLPDGPHASPSKQEAHELVAAARRRREV